MVLPGAEEEEEEEEEKGGRKGKGGFEPMHMTVSCVTFFGLSGWGEETYDPMRRVNLGDSSKGLDPSILDEAEALLDDEVHPEIKYKKPQHQGVPRAPQYYRPTRTLGTDSGYRPRAEGRTRIWTSTESC
eukprot:1418417-Rhodomonas_salina.1